MLRRCSPFTTSSLVILCIVCLATTSLAYYVEWGPDLEGPWCATRPRGSDCCLGREDSCSVPLLGSECYCDIFCNETAYDCCPDYWAHCHGYIVTTTTPRPTTMPRPRPPGPCRGPDYRDYPVGDGYKENCNTCTCVVTGGSVRRSEWFCTEEVCLIQPDVIDYVNDGPFTWRASNYSKLWGMTLNEGVRYRLGTYPLVPIVASMTAISQTRVPIPDYFDSRLKWPGQLDSIRDQGNCGSSWAHSTVGVASDRLGIDSLGTIKEHLSAQHLISCNTERQEACNGGHVDTAWLYMLKHGVVPENCYPYTSGDLNTGGACLINVNQSTGFCPSGMEYDSEMRFHASPAYRIKSEEENIMLEIQLNGPVQAIMHVKEDFYMYRGGIYSYTGPPVYYYEDEEANRQSGYHSVKIIGWGTQRTQQGDIKYWICANSWGPEWGENGYFRILRGGNESDIETNIIGVWTNVVGNEALNQQLAYNRRFRQQEADKLAIQSDMPMSDEFRSPLTSRQLTKEEKREERRRRRQRKGSKKTSKGGKKKLTREERQKRRERRRERRRMEKERRRMERQRRRMARKLEQAINKT